MERTFYFSLLITVTSTALGSSLVVPLLPVYAQSLGATGFELGLIFSAFALARSIFLPMVGRWSDLYGRRRFMLGGLMINCLIGLGLAWSGRVYQLVICRLIQGASASMVLPLARSYVGDMTPTGWEGRTMGHFNMAFFGGLALGPFLGGFIKDSLGIDHAFYSMTALTFFGVVLCWRQLPRQEAPREIKDTKNNGYRSLLARPALAAMFLFRFGSILGLGVNWTFQPLYGHEILGLSGARIGILVGLTVAMTTLLQPVFGRLADRISRVKMTFWGGILASLCLFMIPNARSFQSLFLLNLLMGSFIGLYMPPLMAMAVDAGRETGAMTRVMSMLELAFSLGMVIGPLMAGSITELFGLTSVFRVGGVMGVTASLLFVAIHPRKPTPETPAVRSDNI